MWEIITTYNLRSNEAIFYLQKPNTNFMKKSISYLGEMLWNQLPKGAKERQILIGQFRTILVQ